VRRPQGISKTKAKESVREIAKRAQEITLAIDQYAEASSSDRHHSLSEPQEIT
jgi:hypothetical protein